MSKLRLFRSWFIFPIAAFVGTSLVAIAFGQASKAGQDRKPVPARPPTGPNKDDGKPGTFHGKRVEIDVGPIINAAKATLGAFKTAANQDCANGNFDTGTFSGWSFGNLEWIDNGNSGSSYFASNSNLDSRTDPWWTQYALVPNTTSTWANWQAGHLFPTGQGNNFNTSMTPQKFFDLPFSCNGGKVLRLGNPSHSNEPTGNYTSAPNGHDGETATFAFTVTPNNRHFGFRFAAFVQRHDLMDSEPAFNLLLVDSANPMFFLTAMGRVGSSGAMAAVPNSGSGSGNTDYWYYQAPMGFVFEIPASYVGRTFYAVFSTHGCGKKSGGWGGHSAYAFIDDLCDETIGNALMTMAKTTYCINEPILADGSCSVDALSHTWRVEQCSAAGVPVSGTAAAQSLPGVPSNTFDVAGLASGKGKPLQCGKYYKLTLSIAPNVEVGPLGTYQTGGLGGGHTTFSPQTFSSTPASKVFFVACSSPVLRPMKTRYCQGESIIADGTPTDGETSYSWTLCRLDSNGNEIPLTKKSQTFSGTLNAPFDIGGWYTALGGALGCDADYKLTLKATMACAPQGSEVSQKFRIDCCKELDCCKLNPLLIQNLAATDLKPTGRVGEYGFSPFVSWSGGANRVEATIANVVRAVGNGPQVSAYGYIQSAGTLGSVPAQAPQVPNLLFPRIARWEGSAAVSPPGMTLPLTLRFPARTPGKPTYLKFTLKVAALDADCHACETYQTFHFRFDSDSPSIITESQWPKPAPINGNLIDLSLLDLQGLVPEGFPKNILDVNKPRVQETKPISPFPTNPVVWPFSTLLCCPSTAITISPCDLRMVAPSSASYAFTPVIASTAFPAARVEITMVNAVGATSNSSTYPIYGFIHSPSIVGGFASPQLAANPFSHIVHWVSSGTALTSGLGFPMMCAFPTPPAGGPLYVHFTMRYSLSDQNCRPCDVYKGYYFKLERGKMPVSIDPKNWPVQIETGGGNGDPSGKKGGGSGRKRILRRARR